MAVAFAFAAFVIAMICSVCGLILMLGDRRGSGLLMLLAGATLGGGTLLLRWAGWTPPP